MSREMVRNGLRWIGELGALTLAVAVWLGQVAWRPYDLAWKGAISTQVGLPGLFANLDIWLNCALISTGALFAAKILAGGWNTKVIAACIALAMMNATEIATIQWVAHHEKIVYPRRTQAENDAMIDNGLERCRETPPDKRINCLVNLIEQLAFR